MIVFIVIREDRHVDDEISVHQTRVGADAAAKEFMDSYDPNRECDMYVWYEREYGRPKWVFYADTHDDGPKVRIEQTEVRP